MGTEDAAGDGDLVEDGGKLPVPPDVAEAVRTLIRWAGDNPSREGLLDTPKRVARAWREYCAGYAENPDKHLERVFEEVGGYDEIVLLKDIPFQSHCEHHMAPIIGQGARRLSAAKPCRRHLQARARAPRLCPPPAGAGTADGGGRRLHLARA